MDLDIWKEEEEDEKEREEEDQEESQILLKEGEIRSRKEIKIGWNLEGYLWGRQNKLFSRVSNFKNIVDCLTICLILVFLFLALDNYDPENPPATKKFFIAKTSILALRYALSLIDAYFILSENYHKRESVVMIFGILNPLAFCIVQIMAIIGIQQFPWIRKNIFLINLVFLTIQLLILIWCLIVKDIKEDFLMFKSSGTGYYCGLSSSIKFFGIVLIYTRGFREIEISWVLACFPFTAGLVAFLVIGVIVTIIGLSLSVLKQNCFLLGLGVLIVLVTLIQFPFVLGLLFIDDFLETGEFRIYLKILVGVLILFNLIYMIFTIRIKRNVQNFELREAINRHKANKLKTRVNEYVGHNLINSFLNFSQLNKLAENIFKLMFETSRGDGDILARAEEKNYKFCVICMERVPDVVFKPCGHMSVCERCAIEAYEDDIRGKNCLICRKALEGYEKK